ncbi:zinc ribbon domain-containing protein [soil metagenome]
MNAATLIALQEIDSALDSIANKRPRLPEVAAHHSATVAVVALRAKIAAAEGRVTAAQAAIESAEHASADLTTKRARLEAQLKTVIAPREAEALMHEIATINSQRGGLDDDELSALDSLAEGESELAARQSELPGVESVLAAALAALNAAAAGLDVEATELATRREAAVGQLAADELSHYEQVRHQFGGVGVARLEGSHCSGCHMDLSPAELDSIKSAGAGEASECPQCGRMLVR